MDTKISPHRKLSSFKHFQFFLWLFCAVFGMISVPLDSGAADNEGSLYTARGKRDPFVQLVTAGAKASAGGLLSVENPEEISIEGLVVDADPKKSIVVVNGSVLKQGEEVGNVKVLEIKPEGAVFSVNGVDVYKPLYQEVNKK
jgi:hypothetical protein